MFQFFYLIFTLIVSAFCLYSISLVRLFTELCLLLIEFLISLISKCFLIFLSLYWIPFPNLLLISFSISCFSTSTIHEVCVSNFFEHIQCSVLTLTLNFPIVGSWDTETLRSQVSFWNSILLFVAPLNVMCQCGAPISQHHKKRVFPVLQLHWVFSPFLCLKICIIELRVKIFLSLSRSHSLLLAFPLTGNKGNFP